MKRSRCSPASAKRLSTWLDIIKAAGVDRKRNDHEGAWRDDAGTNWQDWRPGPWRAHGMPYFGPAFAAGGRPPQNMPSLVVRTALSFSSLITYNVLSADDSRMQNRWSEGDWCSRRWRSTNINVETGTNGMDFML